MALEQDICCAFVSAVRFFPSSQKARFLPPPPALVSESCLQVSVGKHFCVRGKRCSPERECGCAWSSLWFWLERKRLARVQAQGSRYVSCWKILAGVGHGGVRLKTFSLTPGERWDGGGAREGSSGKGPLPEKLMQNASGKAQGGALQAPHPSPGPGCG